LKERENKMTLTPSELVEYSIIVLFTIIDVILWVQVWRVKNKRLWIVASLGILIVTGGLIELWISPLFNLLLVFVYTAGIVLAVYILILAIRLLHLAIQALRKYLLL